MARIPTSFDLSSPGSLVSGRPIATVDTTAVGKGLEQLGSGLQQAGGDLAMKARQEQNQGKLLQATQADAGYLADREALRQKVTSDGDYGTQVQRYDDGNKALIQKWAPTIADSRAREIWSLDQQKNSLATRDSIYQTANNGIKQTQVAGFETNLDKYYQIAADPKSDDSARKQAMASTQATIDEAVKAGIIAPETGKSWGDKYVRGADFARAVATIKSPDGNAQVIPPVTAGGDFFSKIRGKESGGNDQADSGIAVGRYQFTAGTWAQTAKNHPDLGLTPDGRTDPAQQEKAVRALTADNAASLKSDGINPTEKNLYFAHFMGATGANSFIKKMQADPSQSAAAAFPKEAASNKAVFYDRRSGAPLSLSQVYSNQTARFTGDAVDVKAVGNSDPFTTAYTNLQHLYPSLTPEQLQTAAGEAVQAKIGFTAQDKVRVAGLQNELQNNLIDGKAGLPQIEQARQQGWLPDADTVEKFRGIVTKRDGDTANAGMFMQRMDDGKAAFNPFDEKDQKGADATFQRMGGSLNALDLVYQRTGIIPKSAATQLRAGIFGADPALGQQALEVASNVLAKNPNGFRSVADGNDIANSAVKYQHYLDQGMNADAASKRVLDENNPAFKPRAVSDTDMKTFTDGITVSSVGHLFDQHPNIPGFGDPRVGADPVQQGAILADFRDVAVDFYKQTGDPKLALAQATAQLAKVYGVTSILGQETLTKYPPEKSYPPVAGSYDYITNQAADEVRKATGKYVDRADIGLLQAPQTAQQFLAGKPAPYQIVYFDTVNGQKMLQTLNGGLFIADPTAAQAAATNLAEPQFRGKQLQIQQQEDAFTKAQQDADQRARMNSAPTPQAAAAVPLAAPRPVVPQKAPAIAAPQPPAPPAQDGEPEAVPGLYPGM